MMEGEQSDRTAGGGMPAGLGTDDSADIIEVDRREMQQAADKRPSVFTLCYILHLASRRR
jgi:hypothetical protein